MDNSATKFGYAFYLSYFYRNILVQTRKFEQITLKKTTLIGTINDFCMGISLAISIGCYPLTKIDTDLFEERKLARSIGARNRIFLGQKGS